MDENRSINCARNEGVELLCTTFNFPYLRGSRVTRWVWVSVQSVLIPRDIMSTAISIHWTASLSYPDTDLANICDHACINQPLRTKVEFPE